MTEPSRTVPRTAAADRRPPAWLPRALVMAVVAVFLGVLTWRALGQLGTVLTIVVISWFISLAMEPAVKWLVQHGMKRGLATGLVMIGSIVAVVVVLALFGGLFVAQLVDLVQDVPRLYADLTAMLDESFGIVLPGTDEVLERLANDWGDDLAFGILGVGGSIVGFFFVASAVLLVVYYMVSAGPRFRAAICRLLAPRRQREVLNIWEVSQAKVADFINSRLILAALSTAFTFAFLTIVHVPYALPLAAFTGVVSQFVPTIGTYLGGILPIAVAFSVSPLTAVGVLVFILAYQQLENLVFAPKVSARSLELNPAMSFLAVLAFGAVFGALGAFLALPVAATIQAVSGTYVRRHELVDSELLRAEPGQTLEPKDPEATRSPDTGGNDDDAQHGTARNGSATGTPAAASADRAGTDPAAGAQA
ncbi:AI-2E family transporter [Cellulomonas sp. NS3]|uniref:AI-2E family transporter n=1 Tax=Cellulomonas sp. NS3 TaxID=2973977 RepID=UPI0021626DAD|nr:AI-2E family transporter [Cellulomonas sp. NS3]